MGNRAYFVKEVIYNNQETINVWQEYDAIAITFINLHHLDDGTLVSFEGRVEDIEMALDDDDHGFSSETATAIRDDIAWVKDNGDGWLRYICF